MFCKQCGTEIDNSTNFCPKCGNKVMSEKDHMSSTNIYQVRNAASKNLCCPKCGNENLQVITETSTHTSGKNYSGGQGCLGFLLFGPLGLLCGSCGQSQKTTTSSTTYWICPKCGKKFRNPDEIRPTLEFMRKFRVAVPLFSLGIFMIILGILRNQQAESSTYLFVLFASILIDFVVFLGLKHAVSELESEIYEIETGMRSFRKGASGTSQWLCECGAENSKATNYCYACGKRHVEMKQATSFSQRTPNTNEWKCSQCGRVNQNYVGTCACGNTKTM